MIDFMVSVFFYPDYNNESMFNANSETPHATVNGTEWTYIKFGIFVSLIYATAELSNRRRVRLCPRW